MLVVVSGMKFEAELAQGPGIQAVYGMNPVALEADVERSIAPGVQAMLSFGTAAGLSPSISAGTIVIARNICAPRQAYAADAAWVQRLKAALPEALIADIAGVDRPIAGVEEKAMLHKETGAAMADMESHRVARIAALHHLPFAALRVVLDGAGRLLPPAALASASQDGSIDYAALVGSLLAHPRQLPAMLRLAGDHKLAKSALLRCGHRLGGNRFCCHP